MLSKINMENTPLNGRLTFNTLQNYLWQILLFLMIFIPRTGQIPKLIVLSLLFGLSLLNIIKTNKIRLPKQVKIFFFLHLFYVIFNGAYGVVRGNPGAFDFFRLNLIYYLLLLVSLSSFFSYDSFQKSIKTIVISANFVSVYSILLLLVKLKIWPENFFVYFDVTSNVGIHSGYTHLVNTNLSMLMFILPFLIILFFNKYQFENISRTKVLFTIILGIVATMISGRRILWLSFIIPIFYYLIKFEKRKLKEKLRIILLSVAIISIILLIISSTSIFSFEMILERFLDAFNSEEESIRFIQAKALWRGFLENPLFGSGAGIGVNEIVRSSTAPWIYEMTYNLILFNSGIIGFSVFAASHLYLLACFFKDKNRKSKLGESLFVTYVVVLVASGTNPYFTSSFDFLWFIIFPLMYFYTIHEQISRRNLQ